MSTAIVLDCETTGFDDPDVIEIAWTEPMECPLVGPPTSVKRYMPAKRIEFAAMATHHILPEELAGCEVWPRPWPLPAPVEYLVGHNVDFDWKAIGSPDVKRICTLALARSCWPDTDSHSLGALMYFIGYENGNQLYVRELLQYAHSASTDVMLTIKLLRELVEHLGEPAKTWEGLYALSEQARIPLRLDFGKYGPDGDWAKAHNNGNGMRCNEVRRYDPGYFSWLMSKCDRVTENPYLQKALQS